MPLYTFKCSACEYVEEKLVSVEFRNNPQECSNCRLMTSNRLLDSTGSFNLKGDGFYRRNS